MNKTLKIDGIDLLQNLSQEEIKALIDKINHFKATGEWIQVNGEWIEDDGEGGVNVEQEPR